MLCKFLGYISTFKEPSDKIHKTNALVEKNI